MQNVLRIVQHKPLGAYLVGALGIGVTNRHLGSKVRVRLSRVIIMVSCMVRVSKLLGSG